MSGIYYNGTGASIGSGVQTLTGNVGASVAPDISSNINIIGAGGILVTGNPGINTLTITDTGSLRSTTYVDSTPYTVLLTDDVILVDTDDIATAINVILPDAPPDDGQVWTVKDWSGSGQYYPITVNTVSSLNIIDNQSTYVLANNYESASFVWSSSLGTYSVIVEVLPSVISLPPTSATTGYVEINGSPVLQTINDTNVFVGQGSGNFTMSGTVNTGVGYLNLSSLTTGSYNIAMGSYALDSLQDGTVNVGLGYQCMQQLVNGSSNCVVGENGYLALVSGNWNLGMGQFCGANYTTNESSNIMLNNGGVIGESNTLRIGGGTGTGDTQLQAAYISGIDGVNVGSVATVVTEFADQLGTAVLTAGAGIIITPGPNTITFGAIPVATSTTFVNSTPYTVLVNDYVVLVDTVAIGAPSTILLIDAPLTDGQEWTIKDATGSSGSGNTITVQSVSGFVSIDSSTSFVINSAFESITVVWSASQSQYYLI